MYEKNKPARRYLAYVSSIGTTQLHSSNPWTIAFWSAMFPGFGHLLLSKYLRGYILFLWEVYVNLNAHINVAIYYSCIGKFDMAKSVIDIKWVTLYVAVYIFAIFDSYRSCVDINNNYILASREDAEINIFKMDAIELNYFDKKSPWTSVVWSSLIPGSGQLTIHRIVSAFFILAWWMIIIYYSNLLPAIHNTFWGNFEYASSIINIQWFLNIPSIYVFAMSDAYVNTVESNKLFDWEQSKFLNLNYQNKSFCMPSKVANRGEHMHIISTFEHSISLEKAITAIQMKGIAKENILAVPMDKRGENRGLFDSIHHADGLSLLDLPFMLGAIFMLFGSIYGFKLTWGPIIWGVIAMAFGFCLGLIIKLAITKKYSKNRNAKKASEVVLIIECKENQMEIVKDLLWAHNALGVRKLELTDKQA